MARNRYCIRVSAVCWHSGANCKACNQYCITVSAVAGTVGPTVREVTYTA